LAGGLITKVDPRSRLSRGDGDLLLSAVEGRLHRHVVDVPSLPNREAWLDTEQQLDATAGECGQVDRDRLEPRGVEVQPANRRVEGEAPAIRNLRLLSVGEDAYLGNRAQAGDLQEAVEL